MNLTAAPRLLPALALTFAAWAPAAAAPGPDQRSPGGATTYAGAIDRHAFSHPAASLGAPERRNFSIGQGVFKRRWVAAPASVPTAAAGLGPLFNARSCEGCHADGGRGQPPDAAGGGDGSAVVRLSVPPRTAAERQALAAHRIQVVPEPTYGAQIQPLAITGQRAEGRPALAWREFAVTLGDGTRVQLRAPDLRILDLGFGPLDPEARFSVRVAPPLIGLGLLEAVAAGDIRAGADPDDADGDGISGRPNLVWSRGQRRTLLGRFGWKADGATLNDQIQAAFAMDLGVSVPLHPAGAGDCTALQTACRQAPVGDGRGLEAAARTVAAVVSYTRNLAVPERRAPDDPQVLAGAALFAKIGCPRCHRPGFVTARVALHPEQSRQRIWPYTDLLLHDLGDGLADRRPEGAASGREWRTAPLWGIGLTATVSGHSLYLHDGRARGLVEAILWHGGEAQGSRDAFAELPHGERERVLRFVESL